MAFLAFAGVERLDSGVTRESAARPVASRGLSELPATSANPVATPPPASAHDNGAHGGTLTWQAHSVLEPTEASRAAWVGIAVGHRDARAREDALHWLGEAGGEVALQTSRQALFDPSLDVRRAAVRSLARMGGVEAEQSLVAILQSPEVSLRLEVLDALALLNPRAARAQLEMAALDGDQVVREAAAEWLEEIGQPN